MESHQKYPRPQIAAALFFQVAFGMLSSVGYGFFISGNIAKVLAQLSGVNPSEANQHDAIVCISRVFGFSSTLVQCFVLLQYENIIGSLQKTRAAFVEKNNSVVAVGQGAALHNAKCWVGAVTSIVCFSFLCGSLPNFDGFVQVGRQKEWGSLITYILAVMAFLGQFLFYVGLMETKHLKGSALFRQLWLEPSLRKYLAHPTTRLTWMLVSLSTITRSIVFGFSSKSTALRLGASLESAVIFAIFSATATLACTFLMSGLPDLERAVNRARVIDGQNSTWDEKALSPQILQEGSCAKEAITGNEKRAFKQVFVSDLKKAILVMPAINPHTGNVDGVSYVNYVVSRVAWAGCILNFAWALQDLTMLYGIGMCALGLAIGFFAFLQALKVNQVSAGTDGLGIFVRDIRKIGQFGCQKICHPSSLAMQGDTHEIDLSPVKVLSIV